MPGLLQSIHIWLLKGEDIFAFAWCTYLGDGQHPEWDEKWVGLWWKGSKLGFFSFTCSRWRFWSLVLSILLCHFNFFCVNFNQQQKIHQVNEKFFFLQNVTTNPFLLGFEINQVEILNGVKRPEGDHKLLTFKVQLRTERSKWRFLHEAQWLNLMVDASSNAYN